MGIIIYHEHNPDNSITTTVLDLLGLKPFIDPR